MARDETIADVLAALAEGPPLVVAVSGGADSTLLARLAAEAGTARALAHVQHHLRAEAQADERAVRDLGAKLGLPVHIHHLCGAALRRGDGGLEAAARRQRYDALARIAERYDAAIATAHHAGDRLETVLLRLTQGAGLRGLGGPAAASTWRGVSVLRPMLGLWRDDIVRELERCRLSWREDHSNNDVARLRNRLRHAVAAPWITAVPVAPLGRSLEQLAEDADVLRDLVADELSRHVVGQRSDELALDRRGLAALTPAVLRAVVRAALDDAGLVRARRSLVEEVARLVPGGERKTCMGHRTRVDLDGDRVLITRVDDPRETPSPTQWDSGPLNVPIDAPITVPTPTGTVTLSVEPPAAPHADEQREQFDREGVRGALRLRTVRSDDEFRPFGRDRRVGVIDRLRRDGVTGSARDGAIVLCDDDGVLAIVGGRRSARARITDETTNCLVIRVELLR